MTTITITEALAEVPTISKRIEKKANFIGSFLFRQSAVRDPHEKDGGSAVLIAREFQAIRDLQNRLINIRAAVQRANSEHVITIGSETKSIADWLTWRREIVEFDRRFLGQLTSELKRVRDDANKKGVAVTDKDPGGYSADYVVNINEKELSEKIENIETVMGTLDGKLSLANATIMIEVP